MVEDALCARWQGSTFPGATEGPAPWKPFALFHLDALCVLGTSHAQATVPMSWLLGYQLFLTSSLISHAILPQVTQVSSQAASGSHWDGVRSKLTKERHLARGAVLHSWILGFSCWLLSSVPICPYQSQPVIGPVDVSE